MKSGYKLRWSDKALADLQNIIDYLLENWTQKRNSAFRQTTRQTARVNGYQSKTISEDYKEKRGYKIRSNKAYCNLLRSKRERGDHCNAFRPKAES